MNGGRYVSTYVINSINYRIEKTGTKYKVRISGTGNESYSDRIFLATGALDTAIPNEHTAIRLAPYIGDPALGILDPSGDWWGKNGTATLIMT